MTGFPADTIIYTSIGELSLMCRQLNPSDRTYLQQGFRNLSVRSKYLRFFTVHSALSEYELDVFSKSDNYDNVAWGILDVSDNKEIPVAVARFVRLKQNHEVAEVAITVVDKYQRKGIGRFLFCITQCSCAKNRHKSLSILHFKGKHSRPGVNCKFSCSFQIQRKSYADC